MMSDQTRLVVSMCVVAALVGLALVAAPACSSTPDPSGESEMPEGSVHVEPRQGVFIRQGFDSDPSDLIGRFIADDVRESEIDENRGAETRCTQHIEYTEVDAGGTYDEFYQASRSAGASLGVASLEEIEGVSGQAEAGMENSAVVRVQYQLTSRMRGNPTDEYWDCCRRYVGECSGRYISEFWAGTGEIYQIIGTERGLEAEAESPEVAGGSVEYKSGAAWERTMSFDDQYFAFTVADAGIEDDDCDWIDNPPIADDGEYFVGVSPRVHDRSTARSRARRDAREQVVEYLGQYIETASRTETSATEGLLEDEEIVQTFAQGVAERVRDDRYCPTETHESPEGTLYSAQVLAFFPEDERDEAVTESLAELEESLEESGELTEEEQNELEEIRDEFGGEQPAEEVE